MSELNKQDNTNRRQEICLSEITEAELQSLTPQVEAWARSEADISKLRGERDRIVTGMINLGRPEISKCLQSFLSIAAKRISRQLEKETFSSDVQGFTFIAKKRVVAPVIEEKTQPEVADVEEIKPETEEEAFEAVELEELTMAEALSAELKSIDPSNPDSLKQMDEFRNFMEENGHWSVTSNGAIRISKKGNSEEVSAEQSKIFREAWKPLKKEVNIAEGQRAEELAKQEAQRAEELAKQEAQRAEELAKQEAQKNQEIENGIRKVLQVSAIVGVYPREEVRAEVEIRYEISKKGKEVIRVISIHGEAIPGIKEGHTYSSKKEGMPSTLWSALREESDSKEEKQAA